MESWVACGLTCHLVSTKNYNSQSTGRTHLAPVVQKVDSATRWINLYPVDNAIGFPNTYPLDSDLSGG